ncbi:MAG: hypothetical protein JWM27_4225 [Gemmatimonadetes bacterium]|nr:hypothetical protein [Gemmatimonadota bacterium]
MTRHTFGIRARLVAGFGMLVVLLVLAGGVGWTSLHSTASSTRGALRGVEEDARLSTGLAADVAREVAEAARYVERSDPAAEAAFDSLRWRTHRTHRVLRRRPNQTEAEVALVVTIDQELSDAEVRYVMARRLGELGRGAEARAQTDSARATEARMLGDLGRLAEVKAQRVAAVGVVVAESTGRRAFLLVLLLLAALGIALAVVVTVIRSVAAPLEALTAHAGRLSEGDLTARTGGRLPRELAVLARAMNRAGESLSRIGAGASAAADGVHASAGELAAVSARLSASVDEVTRSISAVSAGAADQVEQLRRVDEALRGMRAGAEQVALEVREVTALAGEIEDEARTKRGESEHTLALLLGIRQTVRAAADESAALRTAVAEIGSFATAVNQIADQTNLLGLNASIEAARAGEHGAGFGVVAAEVRKLAGQARESAEHVRRITLAVTQRVDATSGAMSAGVERMDEVERVAQEMGGALTAILGAAERTRRAAASVAAAAEHNAHAAVLAAGDVAQVAETAARHADTAAGVRAATAEQEGAAALAAEATARLTRSADSLRALVGHLRVGEAEPSMHPGEPDAGLPGSDPAPPPTERPSGHRGRRRRAAV